MVKCVMKELTAKNLEHNKCWTEFVTEYQKERQRFRDEYKVGKAPTVEV